MNYPNLFKPLQVGAMKLPNRVLLAPLTRVRADAEHVPTELMAEHYAQRASGGLQILADLHVMRSDFLGEQDGDVLGPIREVYSGVLIANMGYSADEAEAGIAGEEIDAVAFGTSYLANPDLPERFAAKAELNKPDSATFYSTGPVGYTDYPTLESARVLSEA
jgi:N-ethylmaleimide reductase